MQDPDISPIDIAESGLHKGGKREDLSFRICDTKVSRRRPGHRVSSHPEDVDAKFVQEFQWDIAQAKKKLAKRCGSGTPQHRQIGPARPNASAWTARYKRQRRRKVFTPVRGKTLFLPKW